VGSRKHQGKDRGFLIKPSTFPVRGAEPRFAVLELQFANEPGFCKAPAARYNKVMKPPLFAPALLSWGRKALPRWRRGPPLGPDSVHPCAAARCVAYTVTRASALPRFALLAGAAPPTDRSRGQALRNLRLPKGPWALPSARKSFPGPRGPSTFRLAPRTRDEALRVLLPPASTRTFRGKGRPSLWDRWRLGPPQVCFEKGPGTGPAPTMRRNPIPPGASKRPGHSPGKSAKRWPLDPRARSRHETPATGGQQPAPKPRPSGARRLSGPKFNNSHTQEYTRVIR